MDVLIIGGSRYFGRRLVRKLLDENHRVTLINRGNAQIDPHKNLNLIKCDRTDRSKFEESVQGMKWDLIYDQVCFDYPSAKEACEIFNDKTDHYIFTSSQSVYDYGENIDEDVFQPNKYSFEKTISMMEDYAEAKRQAEAGFAKFSTFNLSIVRFPMVFGIDDYTGRFKFHVDRIKNKTPIYFQNPNAKISLIHAKDAANILFFIGKNNIGGIFNVCSPQPISLIDLMNSIEETSGGKFVLGKEANEENISPMNIEHSWTMNSSKIQKNNIQITEIKDWVISLTSEFD